MKISEKSWHYRFYSWLYNHLALFQEDSLIINENPSTLCTYFWSQMFLIPIFLFHWLILMPFVIGVCAVILTVASPFLLLAFIFKKNKVLGDVGRGATAIIKAHKSKICPLISWCD